MIVSVHLGSNHTVAMLRAHGIIDISHTYGHFAPFCNDSDQTCANLLRASQSAPCAALKLGVLLQYRPEPMPAVTALRFTQSRKINLKAFLRGIRSSQVFGFPCLRLRYLFVANSS